MPCPSLFRVTLPVADVNRAAAFYGDLFGVSGRSVHASRHYFDCGGVILALVDSAADGGEPRPNPDNIYFAVDDLEAVHERAARLGCLSDGDVHGDPAGEIARRPWGERSFYAVDPWGSPICFVDKATVFTGR